MLKVNNIFVKRRTINLSKVLLKDIPRDSCVYVLFSECKIIYIGQANNLRNRMIGNKHRRSADKVSYYVIESWKDKKILETRLIKRFKPPLNKRVSIQDKYLPDN